MAQIIICGNPSTLNTLALQFAAFRGASFMYLPKRSLLVASMLETKKTRHQMIAGSQIEGAITYCTLL